MPQIQLPATFFKKERDTVYADWHTELFRELFQNSLDAGSSEIIVDVSKQDTGQTRVIFSDNGCGMTRDVLENVYFKLGESTKDGDDDSIGGLWQSTYSYEFLYGFV